MAQQTINIGASPNDGTGTPLRTAFQYTNSNFSELYTALGGGSGLPGSSGQVIFNDGGTNLAGDTGLTFNKTTDTLGTGRLTTSGDAIVCSSTGDFYVGTTLSPQFKVERATGSATITGDLTVATNRLMVNSVGVSTGGSPAGNFGFTTVGKTGGIFANKNAANQYLAFQMKNSTQDYAMFIDQDGVGSNSWSIFDNTNVQTAMRYYPGVGGSWNFHQNGGVAASVTATDLDLVNRNLKVSSGKGIDFSATPQPAGMTSELLSDYEEGTWTGTLTFSTTPQTSSNTFTGRYTKVGRIVTLQGSILIAPAGFVKGPASGTLQITGIPFAPGVALTQYQDFAAALADMSAGSFCFASANAGGVLFAFESMSVSGTKVQRDYAGITAANFAATNAGFISLQLNITYTV